MPNTRNGRFQGYTRVHHGTGATQTDAIELKPFDSVISDHNADGVGEVG